MTALIVTSANDINLGGGNIVINEPAGLAVDDVLYATLINFAASATNPGALTGFTDIIDPAIQGVTQTRFQRRVADGSEGPTYTSTVGAPSDNSAGQLARIQGVDPADVVDGTNNNAGSGTTITLPTVTTGAARCLAIATAVAESGTLQTTAPTGWWLWNTWLSDGSTNYGGLYFRFLGASGTSSASGQGTISCASGNWVATVVTVNPDVSPWPTIGGMVSELGTSLGSANTQPVFDAPQHATATGDLMLYWVGNDAPGATDITASTGWDVLSHQVQGSNVIKGALLARIADGGANDTLAVTGAAQDYCVTGVIIPADEHGVADVTTDIKIGNTTGASGNADPPSLDTGAVNDWLTFAACVTDFNGSPNLITASPAGWGTLLLTKSVASTTSVGLGLAALGQNGQTINPGAFTNTSRPWIAWTIAIPPAGVATVDVDPVATIVTAHSAVAVLTATATVNPAATTVSPRAAVAAVTATATVAPSATVVTAHSAVASFASVAEVNPAGTVVTAHCAVGTVTATATLGPTGTVVAVHAAVATVTATATVNPAATVITASAAVSVVTGTATITPAGTIVAARTAVASISIVAEVDAAPTVITAHTAVAAITATAELVPTGTTVTARTAVAAISATGQVIPSATFVLAFAAVGQLIDESSVVLTTLRMFAIRAEDRTLTVAAEDRTRTVRPEDRTLTMEAP